MEYEKEVGEWRMEMVVRVLSVGAFRGVSRLSVWSKMIDYL